MKKRSDGRYCKQILVGYKPDGKRKVVNVYGDTKKEVEFKERKIRDAIDSGGYIPKGDTLSDWLDTWLEVYKTDISKSTLAMYKNAIEKHLKPMLGNMYLVELKAAQLQQALNAIAFEAPRVAQICRLTLKQAIKQAVADDMIAKDVAATLKPVKRDPEPKSPLSPEEIEAMELADLSAQESVFVKLLRHTGLRRGEALALTVEDFDLERKTVTVNKNLAFNECDCYIKDPKTKSAYRTIPIPSAIFDEVKSYLLSLSGNVAFPMSDGNYRTKDSFRRFWESIKRKTKGSAKRLCEDGRPEFDNVGEHLTPHRFRHTYATNLYYAGVDIKTAQYLLGHASVQITLEIYTHLDKLKTTEAVSKIDAFFGNENQSKISQGCKN